MKTLSYYANLCNECEYAPCLCGMDVQICALVGRPLSEDGYYKAKYYEETRNALEE